MAGQIMIIPRMGVHFWMDFLILPVRLIFTSLMQSLTMCLQESEVSRVHA